MTDTRKCPYCDTELEFTLDDGRRMAFTAHDAEFCNGATRYRVQLLERVLVEQREDYERHIAGLRRRVDRMLAEHGLPSLDDGTQADAVRMAACLGLTVSRSALGDIEP